MHGRVGAAGKREIAPDHPEPLPSAPPPRMRRGRRACSVRCCISPVLTRPSGLNSNSMNSWPHLQASSDEQQQQVAHTAHAPGASSGGGCLPLASSRGVRHTLARRECCSCRGAHSLSVVPLVVPQVELVTHPLSCSGAALRCFCAGRHGAPNPGLHTGTRSSSLTRLTPAAGPSPPAAAQRGCRSSRCR